MSQRPRTASRPTTSGKRKMSTSGQVPLPTGAARPFSRSVYTPVQGLSIGSPLTVADRPMTQHGLGGLKTGMKPTQRMVQDKTYFMGLLRTKIHDLNREIGVLSREGEQLKHEQATYRTYDKKAAELALAIKTLLEELGDHNMLADKLSTDTELQAVKWESEQLRQENEQLTKTVEELFAERQHKEQQIVQLDQEVEEEKKLADSLVLNMQPEMQQKYTQFTSQNKDLQHKINAMQQELDELDMRKVALESDVAASEIKQEALGLHEKIRELEEQQEMLSEEERLRGTPKQEREKLLKQVKEDNLEIATMDQHIKELKDQISRTNEAMMQLDEDLEAAQSEKNQQYLELRKREDMMDQFLKNFDETQVNDTSRKSALEVNIVELLEKTSFDLSQAHQLPSILDLHNLKDDLVFKENEMEKSKATTKGLLHQQQRLRSHLQKMELLDNKMKTELSTLKEKIDVMKEELVKFENIDGLHNTMQDKEMQLNEEQKILSSRKAELKVAVSKLQADYDDLKKQLGENEAHIQLGNLERKWQHIEQNNFLMKDYIMSKKLQTNYKSIIPEIFKQIAKQNALNQNS